MENIFETVLTFLLGSVAGVVINHWFDYKYMVYKELWEKRYESYKEMFKISASLPLYPQPATLSYEALKETSEKIRDWYFAGGGLLLSSTSRGAYFDVQKNIQKVIKDNDNKVNTNVPAEKYEQIREALSTLRTEFTNDLMSRKRVRTLSRLTNSGK